MKVLTDILKVDGFPIMELYQMGNVVHICSSRIADYPIEFKTQDEAKAFITGVKWAVQHYGGELFHFMKHIPDTNEIIKQDG